MNVAPGVNSVKPANPGTAADGGGGGTKPNTKGQKHVSRNSRDIRDKQNTTEPSPAKYGGRTSGGIVGSFSSKSVDIGVSSNATHSEKRARIDNVGEYHEYPPQSSAVRIQCCLPVASYFTSCYFFQSVRYMRRL